MPVLRNPKHERFAQLVSQGVKPTEAAKSVGYSALRSAATGSELVRERKIAERIEELTAKVTEQIVKHSVVDRSWVLERLKENLERAMQHEPVRDSKGKETGEYVYQGNVANRALELIGKELGMFIDRGEFRFLDKPIEELPYDQLATIAGRINSDHSSESIN
jgi:phage terminase small subunit